MESTQVYQLIYYSRSVMPMSDSEAQKIAQQSADYNKANDVTGMLIYRDGYFLQILEGEIFNVSATFKKIRDDKRHSSITVWHKGQSSERIFNRWAMAFLDSSNFDPDLIEQTVGLYNSGNIPSRSEIIQLFHKFLFKLKAANH